MNVFSAVHHIQDMSMCVNVTPLGLLQQADSVGGSPEWQSTLLTRPQKIAFTYYYVI